MAIVQYKNSPQVPSYLGMSKEPDGIKPNKAGAHIAETIANAIESGFSGIDEIFKQEAERAGRIEGERITAAEKADLQQQLDAKSNIDPVTDNYIPTTPDKTASGSAGVTPDGAALPYTSEPSQYAEQTVIPTTNRAVDNMRTVGQGVQQGKVTDVYRQMHAGAVRSDLYSQFPPGYHKNIDAGLAKYGLSPNREVATMRQALNQANDAERRINDKWQAFEDKNRDKIEKFMKGFFDAPPSQRRTQQNWDQLNKKIGGFERSLQENKEEQDALTLDKANKEQKADKQGQVLDNWFRIHVNVNETDLIQRGFSALGIQVKNGDTAEGFRQLKVDLASGKYSIDQLTAAARQIRDFQTIMVEQGVKHAGTMKGHFDGTSALELLGGAGKVRERLAGQLSLTTDVLNAIDSKGAKENFDVMYEKQRAAEAVKGSKEYNIVNDKMYEFWERTKRIKDATPATWQDKHWFGDPARASELSRAADAWMKGASTNILSGDTNPVTRQPLTYSQAVDHYVTKFAVNDGKMPPPRDANALMSNIHQNITNPTLDKTEQIRYAKAVFEDKGLLTILDNAGAHEFLKKYAGAPTGEHIYKLGDPQLIEGYKSMMRDVTVRASQNLVANTKDAATMQSWSGFPKMNLQYNPETNRVEGNALTPVDAAKLAKTTTEIPMMVANANKVMVVIDQANQIFSALDPIVQRDGNTAVPVEALAELQKLGIPIKVQSEGTTPNKGANPTSGGTEDAGISKGDKLLTPGERNAAAVNSIAKGDKLVPSTPNPEGGDTEMRMGTPPAPQPQRRSEVEIPPTTQLAAYAPQDQAVSGAEGVRATAEAIAPRQTSNPVFDLTRRAEGTKGDKGYNTRFGGKTAPLTDMTIREALEYQASLPKNQRAIGVGQFIPSTLRGLVKEMKLDPNQKFDKATQDAMIERLMERRGLSKWLEGDISDKRFAANLAKEWAGLPDPRTGRSFYEGVAGNKSTVSVKELMNALRQYKAQKLAELESGGLTTKEASMTQLRVPANDNKQLDLGTGGFDIDYAWAQLRQQMETKGKKVPPLKIVK